MEENGAVGISSDAVLGIIVILKAGLVEAWKGEIKQKVVLEKLGRAL